MDEGKEGTFITWEKAVQTPVIWGCWPVISTWVTVQRCTVVTDIMLDCA
jgi:hypothetical protein